MSSDLSLPTTPEIEVRIRPGEPLGAELRRICLIQFDRVLDGVAGLPDPDTGIHESRKALKRLRALLRLVRGELGSHAFRQENVVLRDVGRRLAVARDTAVMVLLIDDVSITNSDVDGGVLARARAVLEADHRVALERTVGDRQLVAELIATLRGSRLRIAGWPVGGDGTPDSGMIRDEFSAVAPGIRRVYRLGRKALRAAQSEWAEERFHEWRKRVKDLRYQVESLQPINPPALDLLSAELGRLGELLGSEHDHAVLEGLIEGRPEITNDHAGSHLLLAIVGHRRIDLQQESVALGRGLYAPRPDDFVGQIGAFWEDARGKGAD